MVDSESRIEEHALTTLACEALESFGLEREDAAAASSILVLADLFGVSTHGTARIASYGERLKIDGINPRPQIAIDTVAPTLIRVDGDNGVGPLVGRRALDAVIEATEQYGMGMAVVHGSNHFGPVAPYCYLAAEHGFASIIGSNATTTIAPAGGTEARLGNNPVGFGMPNPAGDPVILDMAISVVARAKIRGAHDRGEAIPEGWATDANGRPTTDPAEALKGFLLPIGGYKGYGLALMVDLFAGLLSGASYLTHVSSWSENPERPQNLGHFFLLIDARKFDREGELGRRMTDFSEILHATPASDPQNAVKLPGEIELSRLKEQRINGVALDPKTLQTLRTLTAGGTDAG